MPRSTSSSTRRFASPETAVRTGRDVASELAYLTRALKALSLRDSISRLRSRPQWGVDA